MNEMNILTLNGEQYEVADKVAREGKADKSYVDEKLALKADSASLDGKVDKSPIGEATPDDTQEVHLTPEGKLVTKPSSGGGGGSNINDSAIATDSTWSSKKLADTFAPAIHVTMTGTAVSTDMVSPIKHDVECKVSEVPNPETVTVKQYSGNLFPVADREFTEDSRLVTPLPAGTYTLSAIATSSESNPKIMFRWITVDNNYDYLSIDKGARSSATFTVTKPLMEIQLLAGHNVAGSKGQTANWKEITINYGTKDLGYEPYIAPLDFTPNSDGIVSGMTSLSSNMTILTDTPGAIITAEYNVDTKKFVEFQVGVRDGAGYHNSVYRGKNLGSAVTSEQYARIKDGTFKDLFIGDYWTINEKDYIIAGINYYKNRGSTMTKNHLVMIPRTSLYDAQMNKSKTTAGGYVGSEMRTKNLDQAKTIIGEAFPGHVLTKKLYLVNAISNSQPSGTIWVDSTVDLMNEQMLFGCPILQNMNHVGVVPSNARVETTQLPLFAYAPEYIHILKKYWLQDTLSSTLFTAVSTSGIVTDEPASSTAGVRPAFIIG